MSRGQIYLLQPTELVGTLRYKIGMSHNPSLDRCRNGYKTGSRYLAIMECIDPLTLEKNIKKVFNEKFKLIAGNEYFEGNEDEILETFINLVMEYKKIQKEFPNYNDDIEFGGNKQLIKTIIIDYKHIDNYDDENYSDDDYDEIFNDDCDGYCLKIKCIENKKISTTTCKIDSDSPLYNYLEKIINKKIIKNGETYDMNDKTFQQNINSCKKKFSNVVFSDQALEEINNLMKQNELNKNMLYNLFICDCFVNNIPSSIDENTILVGYPNYYYLKITRINGINYDNKIFI